MRWSHLKEQRIKLYRGLASDQFQLANRELRKKQNEAWRKILTFRFEKPSEYPAELDSVIRELHGSLRLGRQLFTDSREVAERYAKSVSVVLVEIQVPLDEVIDRFEIEFQNFARRKQPFELVYRASGEVLRKNLKKWKFKISRSSGGRGKGRGK